MKKLAVILSLLPIPAFGIQPVIFSLTESAPSYTVPEGKVLLIEALNSGGASGFCSLNITVRGTAYPCRFKIPDDEPTFTRPIKIPSEAVITATQFFAGETYTFFCVLASESELYANVQSKVGNLIVAGDTLSFDIKTATARPVKISVEGSTNFVEWIDPGATVTRTAATSYKVSVPVAKEKEFFARYSLRELAP